ncbi:hypothetical protein ACIBO2_36145 [Nonomuraea sp. NPDC050022]|uniref:hypothetical protein n=1 Tax=unclassified Nonomuraea TaxID=2593643 RepID=UPI00340C5E38
MRSSAAPAQRRGRAVAGLMLVAVLVAAACQIGPDAKFSVVNETKEKVVVTWNERVYATLPPGRSRGNSLPADYCGTTPPHVDRLAATSSSGKRYHYNGRVCAGNIWHVTSPND